MNDQTTWTVVQRLKRLGRTESAYGERVCKSRLMANRYQDAPNQEMERLDLLEARNFKDLADIEERFVALGLRRLAEMDDLKRQMLTLLDEWKAVTKPQSGERAQPTA
jgi:hypothetical protein